MSISTVPQAGRSLFVVLMSVSSAHWISHVYMLILPLLYPFLVDAMGVSYLEIGLTMTAFQIVATLTQAPAGALVDRVGARRVLMAGLLLGSVSLIAMSISTSEDTAS